MTHATLDDHGKPVLRRPYVLPTALVTFAARRRIRRPWGVVLAAITLVSAAIMIAPIGGDNSADRGTGLLGLVPGGPGGLDYGTGPGATEPGGAATNLAATRSVSPSGRTWSASASAGRPARPGAGVKNPVVAELPRRFSNVGAATDTISGPTQTVVATFAGLTGEGCPQTAAQGYYRSGWSSDWYTRFGGLAVGGCSGSSVHVPMSGSATDDDVNNVIVWWFKTAPVSHGTCRLSVYLPNTGTSLDSAGKPAYYLIFGSTSISGTPISWFTLDQTGHPGAWVYTGTFTITAGELAIRMVTRGIDRGPGRVGAHLGAAALKVECSAS